MTYEQQIARFCQGLNEPLDSRLEAMRPVSLQDALLRAKPLVKEIQRNCSKRFQPAGNGRGRVEPHHQPFHPQNPQLVPRVYAAQTPAAKEFPNIRCFECSEMGHYRNKCPRLANRVAMATVEAPNPAGKVMEFSNRRKERRPRKRPWQSCKTVWARAWPTRSC